MVTAAMALRAACSGIGKYEITHTSNAWAKELRSL